MDDERSTEAREPVDAPQAQDRPAGAGAYEYESLLDPEREPPPEEFANPSGIGRGGCDDDQASEQDAACGLEATAQTEDLFLEETKPGYGIPGFEGEEDGGG